MAETDPPPREVRLTFAGGLLANIHMTKSLLEGLIDLGVISAEDRDVFVVNAHRGCLLPRNGAAGEVAADLLREVFLQGRDPDAAPG